MSILPVNPPVAHTSEELLERLEAVLRLAEAIRAELRALNVTAPSVANTCGHPWGEPGILTPWGAECAACCVRRIKQRKAEDAARNCQTDYAAHFGLLPQGDA